MNIMPRPKSLDPTVAVNNCCCLQRSLCVSVTCPLSSPVDATAKIRTVILIKDKRRELISRRAAFKLYGTVRISCNTGYYHAFSETYDLGCGLMYFFVPMGAVDQFMECLEVHRVYGTSASAWRWRCRW